jgi:hypothetical protein
MRYTGHILTGLLLLFAVSLHAQSPWVRSKAGFYGQLSWQFIPQYATLFGAEGTDYTLPRKVSEATLQLYGEYGLGRKSTLVLSLPYRFTQTAGPSQGSTAPNAAGRLSNLGNTSIALRREIIHRRMPLAATLRLDLPAGAYQTETGLRTGYDALTLMPMLSTGIGFQGLYAFGYAGYGFRSGGYSHFLDAGLEAGGQVGPCWLIVFSEWVHPLRNGEVALPLNNLRTGLFVNNQAYWSVGVKAIWQVNRFWGLVASGAGALQAEWVPKSPGVGIGVFFKWQ